MASRAEARGRVDLQDPPPRRVVHRLPRRFDHKGFSHRERLEILLPAPFPILLAGQGCLGAQAPPGVLGVARLEVFQRSAQFCILPGSLRAVGQVYQMFIRDRDINGAKLATLLKICNALECSLRDIITDPATLEGLEDVYKRQQSNTA